MHPSPPSKFSVYAGLIDTNAVNDTSQHTLQKRQAKQVKFICISLKFDKSFKEILTFVN